MKATYRVNLWDRLGDPHEVELLKVNPDGRDSGLFLAHIRILEDAYGFPKGKQLAVGGGDITVRGKTIHDWAKQFNQPDRSKFERDFMQWLWAKVGKPAVVECIEEPRGYRGLEGYQMGERYMAIIGDQYCKVYPSTGDEYCELCTLPVFKRFFKEI